MWTKIYFLLLAVAVVTSGFLTFYSYSWLQSIGAPANVLENYQFFANIGAAFLWISAAALLIIGNLIALKSRQTWALWTTFAYFAVFIVLQTYWLGQMFFDFKKSNNLSAEAFSFSLVLAVAFIVLAALVVFFDQHFIKRLYDRRHPAEIKGSPENELLIEN